MTNKAGPLLYLQGREYLLLTTKISLLLNFTSSSADDAGNFIPVTAVSWDKSVFDKADLEAICREYEAKDDVWCSDFLSGVVLLQASKLKCSTKGKHIFTVDNSKANLLVGPLVVDSSTGQVFKVARLMLDTQAAFVSSIIPVRTINPKFGEFSRSEEPLVPVPSRLYYPEDIEKPLNGIRIAVKDSIALRGLPTSYGSKAWLETYGPERSTASCVLKLIRAGAVIVGKAKSTEFAEGTDPCEWNYGVCQYNRRGDGQQKPSGSSTGSAVAVAAYSWLDASIGTDTGGSVRDPAGVNGLYGQRPSTGCISLDGVYGATDLFNTVGIFARSVDMFNKVGIMLVDSTLPPQFDPKNRKYKLLCPTRAPPNTTSDLLHGTRCKWFPHETVDPASWTEAEKHLEVVTQTIEKLLNCKRIVFNIEELWRATPVIGQPRSLDEAVGRVYADITTSGALDSSIDQSLRDYAAKNDGKEPPMAKVVRDRFDYARSLKPADIVRSLDATRAFKEWTENTFFEPTDQDATTIMIFPQSCGRPDYRDIVPDHAEIFGHTFSAYAFGYLVGCPDYTIPISEIPYKSKITKKIEYLPSSMSIVGRPGSDLELFSIVKYLRENNVILDVLTGNTMFPKSHEHFKETDVSICRSECCM